MVSYEAVCSTLRLLPFGAGFILGVGWYVTVRVTTSRICLTLVLAGCFFFSANLALRAASQSKTDWTDLALNGDLALMGDAPCETAGEGGILRLGKVSAPFAGADMGTLLKGLGGIAGAVMGALWCWPPHLHEQSVCSLLAVDGAESVFVSLVEGDDLAGVMAGELIDMDLRKSMYAVGGLMGVFA